MCMGGRTCWQLNSRSLKQARGSGDIAPGASFRNDQIFCIKKCCRLGVKTSPWPTTYIHTCITCIYGCHINCTSVLHCSVIIYNNSKSTQQRSTLDNTNDYTHAILLNSIIDSTHHYDSLGLLMNMRVESLTPYTTTCLLTSQSTLQLQPHVQHILYQ